MLEAAVSPAATLFALTLAAAADEPHKPPTEPTIERVRLEVEGKVVNGWLLDADAEGTTALLLDDGKVQCIPHGPEPRILEVVKHAVRELPPDDLVAGLGHVREGVRDRCEELLVQMGALATPTIGSALLAEAAEVRRRGLRVLAERPAKQWIARIRECLRDGDEAVRKEALATYAVHRPDDLFDVCRGLLRLDPAALVRHEAIGQLGRLGDLHAVDLLLDHLDGCEDRSLRLVTFDALRRLTLKSFGRDEPAWRAWWSNHRGELLPDDSE